MSKIIFNFGGIEIEIQCLKDEKIKDICQRYVNKINKNLNSLIFLYGGEQLNFNLSFYEQSNMIDKERNIMKVLVYKNEDNEYICPKCGEKIKLNIKDDIILSINNINDVINSIKFNIDNIIKISSDNFINIQLKNVNIIINTINNDIKNLKNKINNILNNNIIENINNNYIIAEIVIKDEDVNKNKKILSSYEEYIRTKGYEINNEYKNEDEIKKCEIRINEELIPFTYYYQFKSKGKYTIKYSFNTNITSLKCIFSHCSSLTNINLSNFNTDMITNMSAMFYECSNLTCINLSNFNTKNVTDMWGMFYKCSSLTNINLSNFDTDKVTDMLSMFYECSSLTSINLSNFNTNNVKDMGHMFNHCSSLTNIDLSNFNTNNVTCMYSMFYNCSSLTNINLSNFNTNNVDTLDKMFDGCSKLRKENVITNDKKILNEIKLIII